GGLAGVKDTLLVNNSGLATYNSSFGTSFRVSLAPFEFSHFKQVLSANVGSVQPKTLDAKSGAADYFGYGLTVKFDDQTTQLSWVDEWASSQQFPAELKNIQQTLADTIETLMVRTTYAKMNSSHADLGCG